LSFSGAEAVAKKLLAKNMVASYRGALRVAPHFYNTDDEIDSFMAEVVSLARKERA
jgi:selenocysteine lyase/cysteine desulfurase